jgi:hypothetical protein
VWAVGDDSWQLAYVMSSGSRSVRDALAQADSIRRCQIVYIALEDCGVALATFNIRGARELASLLLTMPNLRELMSITMDLHEPLLRTSVLRYNYN